MTGDEPEDVSDERARHLDRLATEARWLPCSEGCANRLLYGVQPAGARPGMVPGQCHRRAHDPENLGYGGRRVLCSRQWTGKTLAGHKADRAAVVRAALEEAGVDPDDQVPVGTLRQWRYLGTGPRPLRLGRQVRYEAAEVRRWIAEECRGPR